MVAPLPSDTTGLVAVVERGLFATPIADFPAFTRANKRIHPSLDWHTDYCSAPLVGSTGRSFNFRVPCQRHDFAYRNLKRLGKWNEEMRRQVDDLFRNDMRLTCAKRNFTQRYNCLAWAETFYRAVRLWGS